MSAAGARPYIGGQAVIEGVMMRSPKSFVVCVRRPDGSIAVREQPWMTLLSKLTFLRWPLLRGALVLIESLHNGYSALNFSAEYGLPPDKDFKEPAAQKASGGGGAVMTIATLFAVGLFIAVPHLLTWGLSKLVGPALDTSGIWFHVVDGALRIAIL